jgi:hypothetical protein
MLKRELSQCLFRLVVDRDRKRGKLSLEGRSFLPFNERERKQDRSTIFSYLESLKRV